MPSGDKITLKSIYCLTFLRVINNFWKQQFLNDREGLLKSLVSTF